MAAPISNPVVDLLTRYEGCPTTWIDWQRNILRWHTCRIHLQANRRYCFFVETHDRTDVEAWLTTIPNNLYGFSGGSGIYLAWGSYVGFSDENLAFEFRLKFA